MPYCQQFKKQIGELEERAAESRTLLEEYVETGKQDKANEIRTVLSDPDLKQREEAFKQEFIKKEKELLANWYEKTTKGKRNTQEFLDQVEFTNQGRAKIERLNLDFLSLTSFYLPKVFKDIKELYCDHNKLEELPDDLPDNLKVLSCHNNNIKTLPRLPDNLKELSCHNNNIKTLPRLPDNLKVLRCGDNNLETLPDLPDNLKELDCGGNHLKTLPDLPASLEELNCQSNPLTKEAIDKIKLHPNYDPDRFLI